MAKSKKKHGNGVPTPPESETALKQSAPLTETDIAARAFELFKERGGEGGHELADWLQAEEERRAAESRKP